jgi:hypothetical protein
MTAYKTYSEKLTHPKWQRKRLEILNRDGFKCVLCGNEEMQLQIHHKEYKKGNQPWEYQNSVLVTLCKCCHRVVEDLKASYTFPLKVLRFQNINNPNNYTYAVLTFSLQGDRKILEKSILLYRFSGDDMGFILQVRAKSFKEIADKFEL